MRNGFRVFWTDNAINELKETITYLIENWSDKELNHLSSKIEDTLELISMNPYLFNSSDLKTGIRRVVIAKYNTMYYRMNGDRVEILSFFSNRQSPNKRKLK